MSNRPYLDCYSLVQLFSTSILDSPSREIQAYSQVSAHLWAKSLLNLANLLQLLPFGKRVSSAGALVMIVGGGKEAVLAVNGYMPQNVCWTDSKALGIGVARR